MRLQCAGLTDTGMVRDHNEDSFLVSQTESFVVVADGMGGHAKGEVASKMATMGGTSAQKVAYMVMILFPSILNYDLFSYFII